MLQTRERTTVTETPVNPGMFYSMRVSEGFRMLFASTIATNTGFWMYQIALGWLALVKTDSPFFVGLTGFAAGIPMLFLALPAGVLIDRIERRTVLMAAQLAVMFVSGMFALLIFIDRIPPWAILLLAAANGSSMSFVFPTRNAIVPDLVERQFLANAIALNAAGQNSTRVIGPSLAGGLIALVGLAGTFFIGVILQIIAVYWTAKLPRTYQETASRKTPMWESIMIGLRVVVADSFLKSTILVATVITVLVMPYINLMPVFARDIMQRGSTGLGVLMAMIGLGAVSGALSIARFDRLATTPWFQIATAVGFATAVVVFAMFPSFYPSLIVLFIGGWTSAAFMSINQTVMQLNIADDVRGRVLAIYMLTWGMLPIGQLLLGALADRLGTEEATMACAAAGIVIMAVLTMRFKELRG